MAEKVTPIARRRVKLYALNPDRQWDDRGTGHVTSAYVERLKGMSLLVRAENDGKTLLESKILTDTAYQKQQGTLIVWSEGENFDLALSFQEKDGCDEIWEKICSVQGKDPTMDSTQEMIEESEEERFEDGNDSSTMMMELPPCELGKLEQISEIIASCVHNVNRQDKIANTIETENYIKKLLELFRESEDLENIKSLHVLYEIFKNIFLLNRNALLDILFSEENIFDVVGTLEYDPNLSTPKKHREFLRKTSLFKEVIPLDNSDLVSKIHQTFRIQYIQDVALPSQVAYEENIPATLSSYIYFNKVEIVSVIQEDERLLRKLFCELSARDQSIGTRRDLILFLKEFCTFSQTLQPPNREQFYKTLSNLGVLSALEVTIRIQDPVVKAASIDILGFFVEFSPSMVRDHMLQQNQRLSEENDAKPLNGTIQERLFLNIMLMQMVIDCDIEMGGAVQIMGILRILLDPENMTNNNNKAERAEFLSFFYKHCVTFLVSPLMSNTEEEKVDKEDFQTAQLIALILELLTFCVEHHTYHMKNYILNHDILLRVLVLLKSRHSFLGLSAVRFIRKIIGMKDEFYNRHLISSNAFAPLVERLVKNDGRYNLIDSAICEIFEVIRTEKLKNLMVYAVQNFDGKVSHIDYVQTFSILREKVNEKMLPREKTVPLDMLRSTNPLISRSARGDMQEMEDEMWINSAPNQMDFAHLKQGDFLKATTQVGLEDEDDDETTASLLTAGGPTSPLVSSKLKTCVGDEDDEEDPEEDSTNNNNGRKVGALFGATVQPVLAKVTSLVDYDDNSDEDDHDEGSYGMFGAGGKRGSPTKSPASSPTKSPASSPTKPGVIAAALDAVKASPESATDSPAKKSSAVNGSVKNITKDKDVEPKSEEASKEVSNASTDVMDSDKSTADSNKESTVDSKEVTPSPADKAGSLVPAVDCAPKIDEEILDKKETEDNVQQEKKRDRTELEEDDISPAAEKISEADNNASDKEELSKTDADSSETVAEDPKEQTTTVNGIGSVAEEALDPAKKKQKLSLE